MKEMMNTCAGVFLAITTLSLILGGFTFAEKAKFQAELDNRDAVTKQLNEESGWNKAVNQPKMEGYQNTINGCLIFAGGSGAVAIAFAVAAKDKVKA
jgi:hypothetical protein